MKGIMSRIKNCGLIKEGGSTNPVYLHKQCGGGVGWGALGALPETT